MLRPAPARTTSVLLVAVVSSLLSLLPLTVTAGASDGAADGAGPLLPDARPNVVLITTDDMRLDDLQAMPLTRSLLEQGGVTVSTGLSSHPLCCPARAQLLTGQYAHHNGVRSNNGVHGGYGALRRPDDTVARWMQQAGYRTGFVGKFLNGFNQRMSPPAGWTSWHPFLRKVYDAYGVGILDDGLVRSDDTTHSNDVVRDYTVRTVRELAGDTPFFVWSSYVAPHGTCPESSNCSDPPEPALRHRSLFSGVRNPAETHPAFLDGRGNPFGVGVTGSAPRRTELRTVNRRRLQALASADEGIAATLDELQDLGELDSTVVIFTSDNGYLLGEHRYQGKNVPYEQALRVPFLVRGPGLPGGAVRDMVASLVDIAPTIAAVAGATPGRSGVLDGTDLMPYLRGDARPPRYTQLLDIGPSPTFGTDELPWTLRGVRTDRYTLLDWTGPGGVRLFDRRTDPAQLHDVAAQAGYARVRAELVRRLGALVGCRGPSECRRDFGPLPARR